MIPAILTNTILKMVVFIMMKVLKCLRVMEGLEIGLLRPYTLPIATMEFTILVTMVEVDLGLKRPSRTSLTIE